MLAGRVLCQRRGSSEGAFAVGEGECFGESALDADVEEARRVRKADVVSDGESRILQLQAAEFHALLGSSLQEVAAGNLHRKLLSAVKVDGTALSSLLSSSDMGRLLDALVEQNFEDGQTLVEEGSAGDAFYLVTSGTASVSTRAKGDVAVLGAGEHFGEMALVRAEQRAATVTAQGALRVLVLSRIAFTRLLGPLQERLALEMEREEAALGTGAAALKFADLELRQTIGVGAFAQVRLALHRPSQVPYALKVMYKGQVRPRAPAPAGRGITSSAAVCSVHTTQSCCRHARACHYAYALHLQVIAQDQVAHVLSERAVMARCNHPFLLRMAASYQVASWRGIAVPAQCLRSAHAGPRSAHTLHTG